MATPSAEAASIGREYAIYLAKGDEGNARHCVEQLALRGFVADENGNVSEATEKPAKKAALPRKERAVAAKAPESR